VAHQLLHREDVDAIFQEVSGIGVAEHVGMHLLDNACLLRHCFYRLLHATLAVAGVEAFALGIARAFEEKALWVPGQDVRFDASYQVLRKRQVAVFGPFALNNVHPAVLYFLCKCILMIYTYFPLKF